MKQKCDDLVPFALVRGSQRFEGYHVLCVCVLSCVQLFVTPWTKNTGVGLPFPTPGDLLDLGIKPIPPASVAVAGGFFLTEPPGKPCHVLGLHYIHYFSCTDFHSCTGRMLVRPYLIKVWSEDQKWSYLGAS